MDEPTVADVGEFGVIDRMVGARPAEGVAAPGVVVDTGDDAAVLEAAGGEVVACTDMLVEGRHFRLDWSAPEDVGGKAIAQNAADIAAMGGECTGFLVAVGCPPSTPAWMLDAIARGAHAEAAALRAPIIGGDLVQAQQIVLSVTALGVPGEGRPVLRAGAQAGDVVAIAGGTGASAAGLALLGRGRSGDGPPGQAAARLVTAHTRPRPPYREGPRAARHGATAMIDVSDGLLADLRHIADASEVVIRIDPARLRTGDAGGGATYADLEAAAEELGVDPLEWVLGGGEDHALAATFPAEAGAPSGWRVIGSVHARDGAAGDEARWSTAASAVVVGGGHYAGGRGWGAFDA